ncbi:MAG: hypothetical protein EBR82_01010 [Caulobacteraceae bacterium]|nr:hypothetical protein [Caulobacteraceae bacterium]
MAATSNPLNLLKLMPGALAVVVAAGSVAPPAFACRVPYRFNPASEVHEVVVVAVALRRDDWGRLSYETGAALDRETGEPPNYAHNREWTAELRTLRVLKGEAVPTIQVAPDDDLMTSEGEIIIVGGCGDGIETPQPGKTYAVYLDRRDGVLRTTRLVDVVFAQTFDPLFLIPQH